LVYLSAYSPAGIFAFTLFQNEFLYALLFLSKSRVCPVSTGVAGELIPGNAFYRGRMAGALFGSTSVALI
jgi:multiple sugar transport system permease protein